MLNTTKSNLFRIKADALGQGVNNLGKMSAGIALKFKQKYPEMYKEYVKLCSEKLLKPGEIFFYKSQKKPYVVNMATQDVLSKANLQYVEMCFDRILSQYTQWGIKTLAIPKIGCGLGGLDWKDVESLLNKKFQKSDLEIIVCL